MNENKCRERIRCELNESDQIEFVWFIQCLHESGFEQIFLSDAKRYMAATKSDKSASEYDIEMADFWFDLRRNTQNVKLHVIICSAPYK